MVTASPCPRCHGQGQVIATPCTDCRGEGRKLEDRTYHVDVPAGVDTGVTLRLTGKGAVGSRGGPAGDLFVHLRVRPHELFTRDGYDLVAEQPLGLAQATLGTTIRFPTLDGEEDLVVPAGTQPGREFKLRGRGVPHVDGRGRGDLRVLAKVEVPSKISAEEEELLRRYAEERGEAVSEHQPPGLFSRIRSAFK
jgi:molecular chaperone DnaJ